MKTNTILMLAALGILLVMTLNLHESINRHDWKALASSLVTTGIELVGTISVMQDDYENLSLKYSCMLCAATILIISAFSLIQAF